MIFIYKQLKRPAAFGVVQQHGFDLDPSDLFRPFGCIWTYLDLVLRPLGSNQIFMWTYGA